jgi:hypothetical protein
VPALIAAEGLPLIAASPLGRETQLVHPRVVQVGRVQIFVVVRKIAQDLDIKLHELRVSGDYP